MANRRATKEIQEAIVREALDEYRPVKEIAQKYGVADSTVQRYSAIAREGRRQAALVKRTEMTPQVKMQALQEDNRILREAFSAIRNILVAAENALDE